jgi:hypothetical protein
MRASAHKRVNMCRASFTGKKGKDADRDQGAHEEAVAKASAFAAQQLAQKSVRGVNRCCASSRLVQASIAKAVDSSPSLSGCRESVA